MKKTAKRNSKTFTPRKPSSRFQTFARKSARATGHPIAFGMALLTILIWALTGPLFGFSDTWQLVINTGTTIITFLMVFLIQNTQNRDAQAIHLKLDELLRGVQGARTGLVDLEDLTDEQLALLQEEFRRLGKRDSQNHPLAGEQKSNE